MRHTQESKAVCTWVFLLPHCAPPGVEPGSKSLLGLRHHLARSRVPGYLEISRHTVKSGLKEAQKSQSTFLHEAEPRPGSPGSKGGEGLGTSKSLKRYTTAPNTEVARTRGSGKVT